MGYNRAMRLGLAIVLVAGCASGGTPGVDVDGSVTPSDGPASCGEPGLLPCIAIHVSKTGLDTNNGAEDSPMKTISAAITRAATVAPVLPVFIQAGIYDEIITMRAGVDLYGGFDTSWARPPGSETVIEGGSPTLKLQGITVATKIDGVTIRAADATNTGSSSIAILIAASSNIEMLDVNVEAGIGADGIDGVDGATGGSGSVGSPGNPGVERSSAFGCDNNPRPTGGGGGTSICGRTGGAGGRPGVGDIVPAAGLGAGAGDPGGTGTGGTAGGLRASSTAQIGGKGADGASGTPGIDGAGGAAAGTFSNLSYVPANGINGTAGGPGNGGGGGGGGGGGTEDCDSTGSSGGGGGAGGCGGTLAIAGGGGGGSFGVLVFDSTVTIKSSTITASRGGDGGRCGRGGDPGLGGDGGPKGSYGGASEQNDGGQGGDGGKGGAGGRGGFSGGGGGGPSVPVVCVGASTVTVPQSMLSPGTGGMGGGLAGGGGFPGAAGSSASSIGCSFF